MVDHEELLEIFRADLIAANLDPVKHLAIRRRRCKECKHLYSRREKYSDGTYKKYKSCKIRNWNNWLTGGEFACKEFKAKE